MTDRELIEKLTAAVTMPNTEITVGYILHLCEQAADALTTDRAEIERLREQNSDHERKSRDYVEMIEELWERLDDRNDFIRMRGLWEDFVTSHGDDGTRT